MKDTVQYASDGNVEVVGLLIERRGSIDAQDISRSITLGVEEEKAQSTVAT
jgi:hypothetical protein